MSKKVFPVTLFTCAFSFTLLIFLIACGGSGSGGNGGNGAAPAAPAAPTSVTASPGPGYITVSWTDNSDNETGFVIYREAAGSLSTITTQALEEIDRVGPDQTSYVDTDVDSSTAYAYAVEAKSESGALERTAQTDPVLPAPDDGTSVTVTVEPVSVELAPGGPQTFTATVSADVAVGNAVTWRSTGGTIDEDGNYTAPDEPGNYTVTAVSVDDPRAQAEASITVTRTGPVENDPPQIVSLTANPGEGEAPLEVTFSWEVSDPDGNELTCELYVSGIQADIGPDYVIQDCVNNTTQAHTYTEADDYEAALRVVDPSFASTESTVAVSVSAPTITVTNTNDSGEGSLRQAVADAADGTLINFADDVSGTIILLSQLVISSNLTIEGPGKDTLTLNGDDKTRLLTVAENVNATISGISLTQGFAANVDDASNDGGAVRMLTGSTLELSDMSITKSSAADSGGAIANGRGILTLTSVELLDNIASGNGGAIFSIQGDVTLIGSRINGNRATGELEDRQGDGGGIYLSAGTLTVTSSQISSNNAADDSGGISVFESGRLVMEEGTVSGNISGDVGGGMLLSNSVGSIRESSIIGNSANAGGGIYNFGSSLTIEDSTISTNAALSTAGGGIYSSPPSGAPENLTIRRTTISENVANNNSFRADGGGIYMDGGRLTLLDSIIRENTATSEGGGVFGSGLVERSLFTANLSDEGSGLFGNELFITNTTFFGNSGGAAVQGDSFRNKFTLRFNTVTRNAAGVRSGDELILGSNIVAGNASYDLRGGSITTLGHNLIGDGGSSGLVNNSKGDIVGTNDFPADPKLGSLTDNGGFSQTAAPNADSPVLGHIPLASCSTSKDQRGEPRPGSDNACDIGAFEAQ